MKFRRLLLTLAPAAMLLVLSTTISASPITPNGSIAFSGFVLSYTGANLASATSITLSPQLQGFVTGSTGDFADPGGLTPVVLSSQVAMSPVTFLVGAPPLEIFFGPGMRFTFTTCTCTTSSQGPNDLTIYADGTFSDTLGTYLDTPASLVMGLTQSGGPGHAISLSGTISVPPDPVPEPASIALMGSALIGVALLGRKKLVNR